jgi:hypothetical protein
VAAMWKIPGIGRPAVRPEQRLSVDWFKSTRTCLSPVSASRHPSLCAADIRAEN